MSAMATASGSANPSYRKQFNFKDLRSLDESGRWGPSYRDRKSSQILRTKALLEAKAKPKSKAPPLRSGAGYREWLGHRVER
jgi:hypothetical protein